MDSLYSIIYNWYKNNWKSDIPMVYAISVLSFFLFLHVLLLIEILKKWTTLSITLNDYEAVGLIIALYIIFYFRYKNFTKKDRISKFVKYLLLIYLILFVVLFIVIW